MTTDVWAGFSGTNLRTDSGLLVVVVEVDTEQEVFQVRLVAPVDQLGDHWNERGGNVALVTRLLSPQRISAAEIIHSHP